MFLRAKTFAWKSVIKTIRNRGAFILHWSTKFILHWSTKFILLAAVINLFCQGVPMMRFVLFKG